MDTTDTSAADTVTARDADTATMVTTAEAARLAGVSARTVRRWIQRGLLPAVDSPEGQLVSPADLAAAKRAAGHGRGHGRVRGHGRAATDADRDTATDTPGVAVSPAARSQLEAIRDEWLRPLVDRIGELEREVGRLENQRDTLAAELEETRVEMLAAKELLATRADPPAAPEGPAPGFRPPAPSGPREPLGPPAWRARTTRTVDVDAPARASPWWRRLRGRR